MHQLANLRISLAPPTRPRFVRTSGSRPRCARPCASFATRFLSVGIMLVALGPPLAGSEVPRGRLIVADSSDDRLLALEDVDASGSIDPAVAGEVMPFYDDASEGPDLSTPSHLVHDEDGRTFLLDGGTLDMVLVLDDRNEDGDANDADEFRVYYSSEDGDVELKTPNTLAWSTDGALLVADDGSAARRVVRLDDLNGDGDALDLGEATVVYDASAASIVIEDIESLAVDRDGTIYAGDSTLGAIVSMSDQNGDGDYLDADEVTLFFESSEDFALADIDAVAAVDGIVFAADEDSGTILRLVDLDGDSRASGSDEVGVFLDSSAIERVSDVNDFLALDERTLLVLDGKKDTVFVVSDENGDFDALDEGETRQWLVDAGDSLATPNALTLLQPTGVPGVQFVRGDVYVDQRINITDPVALLGYLFVDQVIESCPDALDADDDGRTNITDAIYLLNYLFSGGSAPPPPFPAAGVDPTADELDC